MRSQALPNDPQQLQLMFQVAKAVVSTPAQEAPNLNALQDNALDLLDARGSSAAFHLSKNLTGWTSNPRAAADKFLGDLVLKMGMDKAGLLSEQAALNRIANLGSQINQAKTGLPNDVPLPAGELSATWDGQHPRLAKDNPQIVAGRSQELGKIGLEDLLDTLPEVIGKGPNAVQKDELRARVLPLIEQGISPREHLQPGGIVASELVAMLAGVGRNDKVVDLCAGEHGTSIHLAKQHGAKMVTYEVSDAATAVGRNKVVQSGMQKQVEIRPGSISKLNLGNESVQGIIGNNADGVHYVEDRQNFFDRCHDSLQSGRSLVMNAYIPGNKPGNMSQGAWKELKQGFTDCMGWQGVHPQGINSEDYADQLERSGFKKENVQVIDLGDLYHTWHQAVQKSQKSRKADDPWLSDWMQRSEASKHSLGAIVVAQKG